MNSKNTIIFIFVIMIISLIFIFILRNELFSFIIKEEDFGTYSEPFISNCYNSTGYCSDLGKRTITQTCIPNPKNGNGCLDENNKQTFATKVTIETCTTICRSSVWYENSATQCIYRPEDTDKICLQADTLGYQTVSKTCVVNDSTGSNECILELNPDNPVIPPGCTADNNNIAFCAVGVTVTTTKNCPVVENEKPTCGVYAIRNQVPEGYSEATYPCTNSIFAIPSSNCYGYDGRKYSLDSDFLKPGFSTISMECVAYINTTATGTIPTLPKPETCLSYSGCLNDSVEIVDSIRNGNNQTVKCEDLNMPPVPGCVQSCVYIPENFEAVNIWPPEFARLFGTLTYPQRDNNVITMQYTPCPIDRNNAYVNTDYFSPSNFADCYSFLGVPLLSGIPIKAIDIIDAQNNYALYNLINTCTAPVIATTNSLLWVFKPRNEQFISTQFRCSIFMIFGKNASGYLTFNNGNLIWVQAQTSIFQNYGITEEQADTFVITYNGNSYTVFYENGDQLIGLNIPIMKQNGDSGTIPLDNLNFVSPLFNGEPLDSIEDINVRADAIPTLLNLRYTRENPNTCNTFVKLPLPSSYSSPDI